jgi:hypothetical protein
MVVGFNSEIMEKKMKIVPMEKKRSPLECIFLCGGWCGSFLAMLH